MATTTELSLDCKPHSYSLLLKSFGDQPQAEHTQKLEDYLARLEEERLKIDAFKRELPLCMQLLASAVEASRQQLQAYRANQGARPILEEFIPLKHAPSEASEKASNTSDKANWMNSAQLWSQASDELPEPQSTIAPTKENDIGFIVSPKLALDNKQRNAGAFLPFSKERKPCPIPELALNSGEKEMGEKKCSESIENGICGSRRESSSGKVATEQGKGVRNSSEGQATGTNSTASASAQTHRKARRCWSPELHRRFVNALEMLGGSQVATPKQIRELMKVEGLTNDEVKSHLQKYRLHTRRPSPSPQLQAAGAPATGLIFLGGFCVPPEYATAAHNGGPTLYGAHPSSHASHFCAPPVPQEFYNPSPVVPPPHHQLHHHTLHHQLHVYNTASQQANSSPESDGRGAGDRSESIEDGKSDSSSWKGESGERKGLGVLRDHEGEESNGSEITLKF